MMADSASRRCRLIGAIHHHVTVMAALLFMPLCLGIQADFRPNLSSHVDTFDFGQVDTDGNGCVEGPEEKQKLRLHIGNILRDALKMGNVDRAIEAGRIVHSADINGDGKICECDLLTIFLTDSASNSRQRHAFRVMENGSIFDSVDVNKDGYLSDVREKEGMMRKLAQCVSDVKARLIVDTMSKLEENDGKLARTEYMLFLNSPHRFPTKPRSRQRLHSPTMRIGLRPNLPSTSTSRGFRPSKWSRRPSQYQFGPPLRGSRPRTSPRPAYRKPLSIRPPRPVQYESVDRNERPRLPQRVLQSMRPPRPILGDPRLVMNRPIRPLHRNPGPASPPRPVHSLVPLQNGPRPVLNGPSPVVDVHGSVLPPRPIYNEPYNVQNAHGFNGNNQAYQGHGSVLPPRPIYNEPYTVQNAHGFNGNNQEYPGHGSIVPPRPIYNDPYSPQNGPVFKGTNTEEMVHGSGLLPGSAQNNPRPQSGPIVKVSSPGQMSLGLVLPTTSVNKGPGSTRRRPKPKFRGIPRPTLQTFNTGSASSPVIFPPFDNHMPSLKEQVWNKQRENNVSPMVTNSQTRQQTTYGKQRLLQDSLPRLNPHPTLTLAPLSPPRVPLMAAGSGHVPQPSPVPQAQMEYAGSVKPTESDTHAAISNNPESRIQSNFIKQSGPAKPNHLGTLIEQHLNQMKFKDSQGRTTSTSQPLSNTEYGSQQSQPLPSLNLPGSKDRPGQFRNIENHDKQLEQRLKGQQVESSRLRGDSISSEDSHSSDMNAAIFRSLHHSSSPTEPNPEKSKPLVKSGKPQFAQFPNNKYDQPVGTEPKFLLSGEREQVHSPLPPASQSLSEKNDIKTQAKQATKSGLGQILNNSEKFYPQMMNDSQFTMPKAGEKIGNRFPTAPPSVKDNSAAGQPEKPNPQDTSFHGALKNHFQRLELLINQLKSQHDLTNGKDNAAVIGVA